MTDLTVPMQLAKEVPLAKVAFPCFLEPKYDGVRLAIIKRGDDILIRTRNGKQAHLPSVVKELQQYDFNGVIECEVTLETGKMEDRPKVSGMINSSLHNNPINESALRFYCFDYLTLAEWGAKLCDTPYTARRDLLARIGLGKATQFKLSFASLVRTKEEAQAMYEVLIDSGHEGAMLKHASSKYEFKRSSAWVKMKETKSADLTCISWLKGTGKYENMVGSLVCEGVIEGVAVQVAVGSGLTDSDRMCSPTSYIGKTIEVKYNSLIVDKHGNVASLFLPRFSTVRFDK